MKKYSSFFYTLLIFLVILGGMGIYVYFLNNPSSEKPSEERMTDIRNKVENYLINEKGYSKKEIQSLEVEFDPLFSSSDNAAYSVFVIFVDEPESRYEYKMIDNKISQIGYSSPKDNPIHEE